MQHLLFLLPFLTPLLTQSHAVPFDITITPSQILAIAPSSQSCENAPDIAPDECATAEQAAPVIAASFSRYKITSKAEQAAVLAIMAFESGEFVYNRNHFPGVEGQGTRNMQSPAFNRLYAASLPDLQSRYEAVKDSPGAVLDLLLEDANYDFGSGAWFLSTQCSEDVREGLRKNGEEGWKRYIVDCVGTAANEERKAYWTKAVEALK